MSRLPPLTRDAFPWFTRITTRWMDNDIYGHVNNVVYYSFVDTIIANFLMREAGLDPWRHEVVGIAVENGLRFHQSIAFPDEVHGGLRVARLGTSSCRYEIGIFANDEHEAAADGHFVHVFCIKETQRPTPIPERIREKLAALCVEPSR